MVSMVAFQAADPGSIPGQDNYFFCLFDFINFFMMEDEKQGLREADLCFEKGDFARAIQFYSVDV